MNTEVSHPHLRRAVGDAVQQAVGAYRRLRPDVEGLEVGVHHRLGRGVRLQHIADHSGWEGSDALRSGTGRSPPNLAACSKSSETALQVGVGTPTSTTSPSSRALRGGFSNTAFGDISHELRTPLPARFPRLPPREARRGPRRTLRGALRQHAGGGSRDGAADEIPTLYGPVPARLHEEPGGPQD